MHIVTFYSFKGGTGRSMALVNVAADLLARGRRVLIVDFDLEAPGLDTFPMKLDRDIDQGLVEMITEYSYSTSESPPLAGDYVYEAKLQGQEHGSLWLMPAGCQDSTYDSRFRAIDWQDFYANQGGFVFFEDLKLQWAEILSPDYVLIDSRTGHTDVGGICTRQLPNSVVAMFFPNEQNIRGLAPVVEDIRKEEGGPLQKKIDIHFVMGNVPDLDDEDAILSHASSQAQTALGYSSPASTIHHFDSLSMVEQRLMVVDRPRSKIAKEYRELTSQIVRKNIEDREGATAELNQILSDFRMDIGTSGDRLIEEKIQKIQEFHSHDSDVLKRLVKIRRSQRRNEDALDLYDEILRCSENDYEGLVGRAEVLTLLKRTNLAERDLESFFNLAEVSPFSFSSATRLLIANNERRLALVVDSPAMPSLPVEVVEDVVSSLQRSYESVEYGAAFIRRWLDANQDSSLEATVRIDLILCLIGSGRFEEAKLEIEKDGAGTYPINRAFNLSMAVWGASGQVPVPLFEAVAALITTEEDTTFINYLLCFSLTYWALGDRAKALEYFERGESRLESAPRSMFSPWSYLYRSPKGLRADFQEMKSLLVSDEGKPAFIRNTQSLFAAAPVLLQ